MQSNRFTDTTINMILPKNELPKKVIVIGAGVTGLSTAWQLARAGVKVLLLEANDHVGGMAATFRHADFLLDLGPHKFFSLMEDRMHLLEELMGEELLTVPKRSRICLANRLLDYPIGLLDVMKNLDPLIAVTGGLSYLYQLLLNLFNRREDVSYEDWLVRRFGRKLYELIFAQYARKIWGEPKTLARSLAETRVAIPGLLPLLWQMLVAPKSGRVIHAETFRYPKYGSGQFCEKLAELVTQHGGEIHLSSLVQHITIQDEKISSLDIKDQPSISIDAEDMVISTLSLSLFNNMVTPNLPEEVGSAAKNLKTRDLILLYLVINRASVSHDNWIFFPEQKVIFNRMFEQKNFSPYMLPADKTVLCLEIVVDEGGYRPADSVLIERSLHTLEELKLIRSSEVVEHFTRYVKWAYPVYDKHYQQNVNVLLKHLDSISNLYSVGRQGGFNYVGQIDCLDIGIRTAEYILTHKDKSAYDAVRQSFNAYIVLD